MKYFEMLEDPRIQYRYRIESLEWEEKEGKTFGIGYFKGDEESLPDFIIYKKHFLASLELKNVMEMYTDELKFSLVIFNNIELQMQKEYYSIEAPLVEGLGEQTTYHKDDSVDKKVLSHKKLQDYKVFRLKELEPTQFSRPHVFVDLDIVESALRRELWGIAFEKTLVEE
ncbi:hypothetical protein psyc5s11_34060 [Clostridium gelidum]|uniref:Uncharacterized protein n=1 Tax=Clostridium gelidum TaxID=704125 RepID=A0ABM7T5P4_9CLOT|nr:hypothetical protein [Clostridium gelidum]BCZ47339.1 hypothetical protein psyc5s11_34060 [Clostridium gelidum]